VEGIWHTGVVVYGKEYYFGSGGVGIAAPVSKNLGIFPVNNFVVHFPNNWCSTFPQPRLIQS
jgi:hypothetical protein